MEVVSDTLPGATLERPGIQHILSLARQEAFDILLAIELDRLARVNHIRRQFEEDLAEWGVRVLCVDQRFDDTPSGRLHRGITGELAEHEREIIRDRTMDGRYKKARQEGRMPVYFPLFGYRCISRAEHAIVPEFRDRSGELLVVEQEAALVRQCFEWCAGGRSLWEILNALQQQGARTRRGGSWQRSTLQGMLRNPAYRGEAIYGRRRYVRRRNPTTGNRRRVTVVQDRDNWVAIPCPAIVTRELWEAVQARLDENKRVRAGRPSVPYPLRGVIWCQECRGARGEPLSCAGVSALRKRKNRTGGQDRVRQYRCSSGSGTRAGGVFCGTCLSADRLEREAFDALEEASAPGWLADLALRDAQEKARTAGNPLADVKRAEKQLAELTAEEGKLADLFLAGFSRAVVDERVRGIGARRRELEAALGAARQKLAALEQPEAVTRPAEAATAFLQEWLPRAREDTGIAGILFRAFLRVRVFQGRRAKFTVVIPTRLPLLPAG